MRKAIFTFAVILPFFWHMLARNAAHQAPQHTVAIWDLPEDLFDCLTRTAMYQTVQD